MKQRLTALAIVAAFFIFSVAFGFIIGKAMNKNSIVDSQCLEQLSSCTEELTSGDNSKAGQNLPLGISAQIPEAPKFNRYQSSKGLTFVYPRLNSSANEYSLKEFDGTLDSGNFYKGIMEIALGDTNQGFDDLIMVYEKPADVSLADFVKNYHGSAQKLRVVSRDEKLKVTRYSAVSAAPVNGNGDDFGEPYYITFDDRTDVVAIVFLDSKYLASSDMSEWDNVFLNSISMIKK